MDTRLRRVAFARQAETGPRLVRTLKLLSTTAAFALVLSEAHAQPASVPTETAPGTTVPEQPVPDTADIGRGSGSGQRS